MSMAPFYQGLTVPGTVTSCCSQADCRPVNERPGKIRHEVFIDKKTFGSSAPDDWVEVPEKAIIYGGTNPTGQAVVCWVGGRLWCYVPTSGI